jgi:predicted nuclease of predicted toxin-antitoxin system
MRFFLDENFPKAAHALLKALGHETFDFRGTPREGASDVEIFQEAQNLQAVFLTTDRDFFHTVPHLYPNHSGVVVIAMRQPNRTNILEKLTWILAHLQPAAYENRVIQLRDKTWVAVPSL